MSERQQLIFQATNELLEGLCNTGLDDDGQAHCVLLAVMAVQSWELTSGTALDSEELERFADYLHSLPEPTLRATAAAATGIAA